MEATQLGEIVKFRTNELTNILDLIPEGTSRTIIVTQSLASMMLERGIHNRSLRKAKIKCFMEDMINGKWEINGESLKFNLNGELVDGFHRLTAFKKSGLESVKFTIFSKITDEAPSRLDSGSPRTPGDMVDFEQGKNSIMTATAIKIYHTLMDGRFGDVGSTVRIMSNHDVKHYFRDNREKLEEIITKAQRAYKQSGKIFTPGIFGGVLMYLSTIDKTDAEFFMEKLGTGSDLPHDSPILALRNKFFRMKGTRLKLTQSEILKLCVFAWNKFRENKRCTVLHVPKDDVMLKAI